MGTYSDSLLWVLGIICILGCPEREGDKEREKWMTNSRDDGDLKGSRRVTVDIGETLDPLYLRKIKYGKAKCRNISYNPPPGPKITSCTSKFLGKVKWTGCVDLD